MGTEKIRLGEMRSPVQVIPRPLLFPCTSYLPVHNRASTFGEREDTPGWRKRTTAALGSPCMQHCPSSGQEHSGEREREAQQGQATQTCSTVAPSGAIVLPAELPTSSWCHFCKSYDLPKGWQRQPPDSLQKDHLCHQDAPFLRKRLYRWSTAVLPYLGTRLLNTPSTTLAFLHYEAVQRVHNLACVRIAARTKKPR